MQRESSPAPGEIISKDSDIFGGYINCHRVTETLNFPVQTTNVSLTRVLFKVDAVNDASLLCRKLTRALQLMRDLGHNVTQFNIAHRGLLNQLAQCGLTFQDSKTFIEEACPDHPNEQFEVVANINWQMENLLVFAYSFLLRFCLKTGGFRTETA
jgi:hypothetical protein